MGREDLVAELVSWISSANGIDIPAIRFGFSRIPRGLESFSSGLSRNNVTTSRLRNKAWRDDDALWSDHFVIEQGGDRDDPLCLPDLLYVPDMRTIGLWDPEVINLGSFDPIEPIIESALTTI